MAFPARGNGVKRKKVTSSPLFASLLLLAGLLILIPVAHADTLNSIISHYSFNSTGGKNWTDSTNRYNLTNVGGVTTASGKLGTGFYADGGGDYANITTKPALIGGIAHLTICGWVKYVSGSGLTIYGVGKTASNNRIGTFLYDPDSAWNDAIFYYVASGSADTYAYKNPFYSETYTTANYDFMCYVFNGSAADNANRLKGYRNSTAVTMSYTGTIPALTPSTFSSGWIGGKDPNVPVTNGVGYFDEITVFNRSLTAANISWLYNSGNGRPYNIIDLYFGRGNLTTPVIPPASSYTVVKQIDDFNRADSADSLGTSVYCSKAWNLGGADLPGISSNTAKFDDTGTNPYAYLNLTSCYQPIYNLTGLFFQMMVTDTSASLDTGGNLENVSGGNLGHVSAQNDLNLDAVVNGGRTGLGVALVANTWKNISLLPVNTTNFKVRLDNTYFATYYRTAASGFPEKIRFDHASASASIDAYYDNVRFELFYDNRTNFSIFAYDATTRTRLYNFNVTINGTKRAAVNGRVVTPYYKEDGVLKNVTISAENYVNVTYTNYNSSQSIMAPIYPAKTVIVNMVYENNLSLATGINITLQFISPSYSVQTWTTTGIRNTTLYYPDDYQIRYYASGFPVKYYYLNVEDTDYYNLTLYISPNTYSNVTISVYDTLNKVLEGETVKILKYFISTNSFILVSQGITNFQGKTIQPMELNNPLYKFVIEESGVTVYESTATTVSSTNINLYVNKIESGFDEVFSQTGLYGNIAYNNNTFKATYTWDDEDNRATRGCFYAYRIGEYDKTLVNNSCTSTPSGSITLGVANTSGTTYEFRGYISKDGRDIFLVQYYTTNREQTLASAEGFLLAALVLITLALVGFWALEIAIVLTGLGMIILTATGVINVPMGISIAVFCLSLVAAFFVYKGRNL